MRRLLRQGDGTRTFFHSEGKLSHIETVQDLEPQRQRITDMRNDPDRYRKQFKADGMLHAATIPTVLQHRMLVDYGVRVWKKEDFKKVMKILQNDPDYEGCIVERKAFKRSDLAAGMKKGENGLWRPGS